MNRWTLVLGLLIALLTLSAYCAAQNVAAPITAAEDRASQFVIGETKQSETFENTTGGILLVVGALALAASLAALLLSSRHYYKTSAAGVKIGQHIPDEETES